MMSFKPQIAKVAKPRAFSYFPRYYDERKERIAEMEKIIRAEAGDETKGKRKVREFKFRSAMDLKWRGEDYSGSIRKSNIMILILIAAIFGIAYYLYYKFDLIEVFYK